MAGHLQSITARLRRKPRRTVPSSRFQQWAGIVAVNALTFGLVVALPPTASASSLDFQIWNITSAPITVSGYGYIPNTTPPNMPNIGTVIPVGGQITFHGTKGKGVSPQFSGRSITSTVEQYWNVDMGIDAQGRQNLRCNSPIEGACSPLMNGPDYNTIALWDRPNFTVSVPASDAQQQAQVFADLCNNPSGDMLRIRCDYSNTTKTAGNTPWHMPDDFTVVTNQQNVKTSTEWEVSSTTTRTTTFTISAEVSAKFFKIVNTAIKAQYQEETTASKTFTQKWTLTVPPHRAGYICMSNPLNRFVGTFIVNAGNTTFNLENVGVDTPAATGHPRLETWDVPKALPDEPDPCEGFVRGAINGANKGS